MERSIVLPRPRRSLPSPWTKERIARLKARWSEGATAKEISKELAHGISRSAVLGAIRRLGIAHLSPYGVKKAAAGKASRRSAAVPSPQPAPEPAPSSGRREWQPPAWVRNAKPYVDDPRVDTDVPLRQRRSFLELDSSTCRWPVGDPSRPDFFFCGARPLEAKPYCAAHWARSFTKDTALRPWRIAKSPCRQTR
jgi:GcrA cell cycle regulator